MSYDSSPLVQTYECLLLRPVVARGIVINPSVCVSVCLSASISLEPLNRFSRNFVCASPVAVARSSSGGVALRYVLPVLWMTSRLAVVHGPYERARTERREVSGTWRRRETMAESGVDECLTRTV